MDAMAVIGGFTLPVDYNSKKACPLAFVGWVQFAAYLIGEKKISFSLMSGGLIATIPIDQVRNNVEVFRQKTSLSGQLNTTPSVRDFQNTGRIRYSMCLYAISRYGSCRQD